MSILASSVGNNEINIKLLNILVHSRSKMEVFFLTLHTPPPPPHHPPPPNPTNTTTLPHTHTHTHCPMVFTNALCALADPIHHQHLVGEKALSQGGCFLSSASAAVSAGTRETSLMDTLVITGKELWDCLPLALPPSACLLLSLFHSSPVFTSFCPSSLHALGFGIVRAHLSSFLVTLKFTTRGKCCFKNLSC